MTKRPTKHDPRRTATAAAPDAPGADDAVTPSRSETPVARAARAIATTKRPAGRFGRGAAAVVQAVLVRGTTVMVGYALVTALAVGLVPQLGAYLHHAAGLDQIEASIPTLIAMWIAPLAFLVLLLAAGTIRLLRAMWALGTRVLAALARRRAAKSAS